MILRRKDVSESNLYIRKIFPLEISLPSFEKSILPHYLLKELRRLSNGLKYIDTILYKEILRTNPDTHKYYVSDYLKTFRDVRNFSISFSINILSYLYPHNYLGNISIANFFWLEIIRFSNYHLYLQLRDNPMELLELHTKEGIQGFQYYKVKNNLGDKALQQALNLLFMENEEQKKFSIVYTINYAKYFSYRLSMYNVDYYDFKNVLVSTDENMELWLKKKLEVSTNYQYSIIYYLLTFRLIESGADECNNYIRFVALSLKYTSLPQNYLMKILSKDNFKSELHQELMELFLYVLASQMGSYDQLQCIRLSEQLKQMYAQTIYEEGMEKISCKTILPNEKIKKLQICIFKQCISSETDKLTDILRESSALHQLLINATVLDCVTLDCFDGDGNPSTDYVNLILDVLISMYKSRKETNEYTRFLKKFCPDFSNDYDQDLQSEDILMNHKQIIRYFGNLNDYKRFLEDCFNIPEERKRLYYQQCKL